MSVILNGQGSIEEGRRSVKGTLRWTDRETLEIDGVRFFLTQDVERTPAQESEQPTFVLVKDPSQLRCLQQYTDGMEIQRILDLGIFKGGSAVLFYKLFQPAKLVAIDSHPEPVADLERYINTAQVAHTLRPYYGLDQADTPAILRVLEREFPQRNIDLVVDDASHLYEETRTCFNAVFPYLRTGALYIIEDWSWAQSPEEAFQRPGGIWYGRLALTNLVFEIVMLCGSRYDLISDVTITSNSCYIRRGQGPLPDGEFDFARLYRTRGRLFVPTL